MVVKKVKKAFSCPTCAIIYGALRAVRVPDGAADEIAYSRKARDVNRAVVAGVATGKKAAKKVKKVNKRGKYLKQANAKGRKKNGDFKKGYNQARIMKEAWRLKRKDEK